jgi:hypothetical protein
VAALDRSSVLEWLRSLPEEEFAHLLAEACQGRVYRHYDITDVRYVGAMVWRDGDEPWTVELIAAEDAARSLPGNPIRGRVPHRRPDHSVGGVCGLRSAGMFMGAVGAVPGL